MSFKTNRCQFLAMTHHPGNVLSVVRPSVCVHYNRKRLVVMRHKTHDGGSTEENARTRFEEVHPKREYLHQSDPLIDQLTKSFEKVQSRWDLLEEAQDSFIAAVENEEAEIDYLDEPEVRFQKVLVVYDSYKRKAIEDESKLREHHAVQNQQAEDDRREKDVNNARDIEIARIQAEKRIQFDSAAEEFNLEVEGFFKTNESIQEVVKDASDGDKRRAFEKLEDQFHIIQKKLVALGSIDPTKDTKGYKEAFADKVEKPFAESQKWFLAQLKNSVKSSGESSKSGSSSSSSSSVTKKEAVSLPAFVGDETSSPSPFLVYPVWRKKWDTLIEEYDTKYRCNVLWQKLDEFARNVFAGYESDYKTAMERLDSFYGNPYKVVTCITSEVDAPPEICEGDYQGLRSYCNILEKNFNRLQSMEPPLVHEMSNSSTMSTILCKFPVSIAVKWAEYIETKDNLVKAKPFPTFIEWLISQKSVWERVAAVELRRCILCAVQLCRR